MKRKILVLSSILIAIAVLVSPVLALTQVSNDTGLDNSTYWYGYSGYGTGSHRWYFYNSIAMTEYKTNDSSYGAMSIKQAYDLWGGAYGSSWSLGVIPATTSNLALDYRTVLSWVPTVRSGGEANVYIDLWCQYSQQSGGYSYAELTIFLYMQGNAAISVGSYSGQSHVNQGSPARTWYQTSYHACQITDSAWSSGTVNINNVLNTLASQTGANLNYVYIIGMEFGVEAKNADVNAQYDTVSFHY